MWKVGQEVWDVLEGKGEVDRVSGYLTVLFHDGLVTKNYTLGGCRTGDSKRALFFSEPKVEGATEPPFVPTLQKGDVIAATSKDDGETCRWKVYSESEHTIWAFGVLTDVSVTLKKKDFIVYKLGEPLY